VIAALGLVTTLALWIYERRNTQLYSDLGNLNERIENELGIGEGQFSGARSKAAWPITHGVSIYLVYGASALSWLFTVIYIGRSEKVIEPILLQQQALSPWQQAAWVFTILGVIVAAGSLVVSAIANRQNAASQEETARANEDTSRAERARFLLDLRTMFASHDKVHVDLKPGSKWGAIRTVLEEHDAYKKYGFAPTEEGPSTPQEWAPVEAYMGLFELCEMMLKEDLINEDTFKSLYRYRLTNIMCNKVIVNQKIVDRASGWEGFRALLDRCAVPKQAREPWEETIRSRDVAMSQTPHKVGILQRALGFFASCSGRPTRKKSP
jgi:hypothetical protein